MKVDTENRKIGQQSLSEFVTQMGRNTTSVDLDQSVRALLWVSFGLLTAPFLLWITRPLLGGDPLWFGNGVVGTWIRFATRDTVLVLCALLALAIAVTLFKARSGPPSTPLVAGSAVSVALVCRSCCGTGPDRCRSPRCEPGRGGRGRRGHRDLRWRCHLQLARRMNR